MIILTYDPGMMTGWATYGPNRPFESDETPFMEFIHRAWAFLNMNRDVIVCGERFVIDQRTVRTARAKDDAQWSIETHGALRWQATYLNATHGHVYDAQQQASDAMNFATDEKLKRIGWWLPGCGHANDAARHMLLYVARCHQGLLPRGFVPA